MGLLRNVVATILGDLDAVVDRDPAAHNRVEAALLYPGVHAIWTHRVSHAMWQRGAKLPARALAQASRMITNIEIHPGAQLGPRLFIDHGAGVVLGETAVLGSDVTLYHGVTLGGTSLDPVKRHPTLGDRVMVGAGAKLLGPINVGDDSKVGANAVLIRSVEPGSVVVGVPGQVIAGSSPQTPATGDHDPVAFTVRSLLRRVARLEGLTEGPDLPPSVVRDEVWQPEDYAI
jgi:serine O-acetyltransferase